MNYEHFAGKHLIEIRTAGEDRFLTWRGKAMFGGVFGFGEWVLVSFIHPEYTLLTAYYLVMYAKTGTCISGMCQTKAEALAVARHILKTAPRELVLATIAEDSARIAALEKKLSDAASVQRALLAEESKELHVRRTNSGHVYLVRCGDLYKIGKAINVEARLREMLLPSKPEIIATGFFDRPYKVETALHRQFKHCRENGEWFRLTTEEVDAVKARLQTPELKAVS